MKISKNEIFDSLERSGRLPPGWKALPGGVEKVAIRNRRVLEALREHYPGEWRKVYRHGRDGTEIHYFEHRTTGKVWGVKVK
jgi:hypothetical protein